MTEHPNIFKLYEANIGILVPMIAETLREAEQKYPYLWIQRAVQIAVNNNKRNWHYIEAILKRWSVDGMDGCAKMRKYSERVQSAEHERYSDDLEDLR